MGYEDKTVYGYGYMILCTPDVEAAHNKAMEELDDMMQDEYLEIRASGAMEMVHKHAYGNGKEKEWIFVCIGEEDEGEEIEWSDDAPPTLYMKVASRERLRIDEVLMATALGPFIQTGVCGKFYFRYGM